MDLPQVKMLTLPSAEQGTVDISEPTAGVKEAHPEECLASKSEDQLTNMGSEGYFSDPKAKLHIDKMISHGCMFRALQCTKCGKWRAALLSRPAVPNTKRPPFVCSQNLDHVHNTCDAPETRAESTTADAHGHRLVGPYHYPAFKLAPFTDADYDAYLTVDEWSKAETIALLDYILNYGCYSGSFQFVEKDKILRVRHKKKEQCEARFLHVLAMLQLKQAANEDSNFNKCLSIVAGKNVIESKKTKNEQGDSFMDPVKRVARRKSRVKVSKQDKKAAKARKKRRKAKNGSDEDEYVFDPNDDDEMRSRSRKKYDRLQRANQGLEPSVSTRSSLRGGSRAVTYRDGESTEEDEEPSSDEHSYVLSGKMERILAKRTRTLTRKQLKRIKQRRAKAKFGEEFVHETARARRRQAEKDARLQAELDAGKEAELEKSKALKRAGSSAATAGDNEEEEEEGSDKDKGGNSSSNAAAAVATAAGTAAAAANDRVKEEATGIKLEPAGEAVKEAAASGKGGGGELEAEIKSETSSGAALAITAKAVKVEGGGGEQVSVAIPTASAQASSVMGRKAARPSKTLTEYLIKLEGVSYLHCQWHTLGSLVRHFGQDMRKKVKTFETKWPATLRQNRDNFGDAWFDPRFTEVERIITSCKFEVATKQVGKLNVPGLKVSDPAMGVGITRMEMFLVKWKGLPFIKATWETMDEIRNKTKVAEMRRFNRYVPRRQRPQLTEQQERLVEARRKSWYAKSDTYKTGNKMRDYQVTGVNWLIDAWHDRRNVILADEMGLGKTVQSVCFFEHLRKYEFQRGPFLVVVPLSTANNWKQEANAWTDMNCLVYHDLGGKEGRQLIRDYEFFHDGIRRGKVKFNILVTTYDIMLADVEELCQIKWKVLMIDEGHRLKNSSSRLLGALRRINVRQRVMLTGTPIQNSLSELWSMLNFLEPEQFPDDDSFSLKYADLMNQSNSAELVKDLNTELRPYMLRRMKEHVEKSIPPKEETIIDIELTTVQKKYYRALYERNMRVLRTGTGLKERDPRLVNLEMELRKCCNHPWLIEGACSNEVPPSCSDSEYFEHTIQASGKMVLLHKLLPKLKREGHRVLIFSQMIVVLDILQSYLSYFGYIHERLDGRITGDAREAAIARFNRKDSNRFVFLLSTRAGGVGLNLATADTVIIFDSDWNPQQDMQAQARVHRIGQKRSVQVYRLVTRNTYESEMFNRASKKLGLDHAVLTVMEAEEQQAGKLEKHDKANIEKMLRQGAYGLLNDDEASKKFLESDIDSILSHNARVVNQKKTSQGVVGRALGTTQEEEVAKQRSLRDSFKFSRQTFEAENADMQLDVNDPQFWDKLMKTTGGDQRADDLLSQLTDGSALLNKGSKTEWWERLSIKVNAILKTIKKRRKAAGSAAAASRHADDEDPFADLEDVIGVLVQFSEMTGTFPENQIIQAQVWLTMLENVHNSQMEADGIRKSSSGRIIGSHSRNAIYTDDGRVRRGGRTARVSYAENDSDDDKVGGRGGGRGGRRGKVESDFEVDVEEERGSGRGRGRTAGGTDATRGGGRQRSEDGRKQTGLNEYVCEKCLQPGGVVECESACGRAFHMTCLGLRTKDLPPEGVAWVCQECRTQEHTCHLCRRTGPDAETLDDLTEEEKQAPGYREEVRKCNVAQCGRFYHMSCVRKLRLTLFPKAHNTFRCPAHYCASCETSREGGPLTKDTSERQALMVTCATCPTGLHLKCTQPGMLAKAGFMKQSLYIPSITAQMSAQQRAALQNAPAQSFRLTKRSVLCPHCYNTLSKTSRGKAAIAAAGHRHRRQLVRARATKKHSKAAPKPRGARATSRGRGGARKRKGQGVKIRLKRAPGPQNAYMVVDFVEKKRKHFKKLGGNEAKRRKVGQQVDQQGGVNAAAALLGEARTSGSIKIKITNSPMGDDSEVTSSDS